MKKKMNLYQGILFTALFCLFGAFYPLNSIGQCTCTNPGPGLINGNFEAWGVPPGGIGFFGNSNGWISNCGIEVWGSGFGGVPSHEGVDYLELNANCLSILYQDICTVPGETYTWSIAHRGRITTETAHLQLGPPSGPVTVQILTSETGSWKVYSGSYVVPAGQTSTRVQLKAITGTCGNQSCGNLIDDLSFKLLDSDGNGTADCNDGCPNDPKKTAEGICGCGVADTDSDGDGTADCKDGCPNDPNKIAEGICGCGVADTDTDGDMTPDCKDDCPNDPNKVNPGQCGCGNADTDSDCDGVADCNDVCPGGNDKIDSNNDGKPDCKYPPAYNDIIATWKCGSNKVYICHIPPGNPNNKQTLCVAYSAVQSHITNHGDYLGQCENASCNEGQLRSNGDTPYLREELFDEHGHSHDHSSGNTDLSFRILPNVTDGDFRIEFEHEVSNATIQIYNSLGQIVFVRPITQAVSSLQLNAESFANNNFGLYMVEVKDQENKEVKTLFISR